ncbi:hypothetical protein CRE_19526 [Caenorhabditis remanei]|uniref:Uncharacterized protein n=1 Tax=Caenorhabditis remanei TaxID=31234 RepID=E3NI06_CAERE|nr:hypothetical protein CRE_19526 [Caenorhabditis remanei]
MDSFDPFPILRLPFLAIEEVVKAMHPIEMKTRKNGFPKFCFKIIWKSTRQGVLLGVVATDAQPDPQYMGRMDPVCSYCEALYFKAKYFETSQWMKKVPSIRIVEN